MPKVEVGKPKILTPGAQVDLDKAIARFVDQAPNWAINEYQDFVKAVAARSIDAAHPFLLKAARELREKQVEYDGWTFSAVDPGNPWKLAIAATSPEGWGFLYTLDLKIDVPPSKVSELIQGASVAPPTSRDELARSIIDSLKAEGQIRAQGITDGMPSPDQSDEVVEASIHLFAAPDGAMPDGCALYRVGLPELLKTVGSGCNYSCVLVSTMVDRAEDTAEPTLRSDPRIYALAGMLEGLAAMDRLFLAMGLREQVAASGAAIAERSYFSVSEHDWTHALAEAAGAAVAADRGIAGATCFDVARTAWLNSVRRSMDTEAKDIHRCVVRLGELGFDHENKYDANDGRSVVWLRTMDEGPALVMSDQNSTHVAALTYRGDGSARVLLWRAGEGGMDDRDIGDVKVSAGRAAVAEGHYRATFDIGPDGGCTIVETAKMTDRVIRDINAAAGLFETTACCLSEDYPVAAAGP